MYLLVFCDHAQSFWKRTIMLQLSSSLPKQPFHSIEYAPYWPSFKDKRVILWNFIIKSYFWLIWNEQNHCKFHSLLWSPFVYIGHLVWICLFFCHHNLSSLISQWNSIMKHIVCNFKEFWCSTYSQIFFDFLSLIFVYLFSFRVEHFELSKSMNSFVFAICLR